ncbi:helix-turn-helix transcriptional regulator [Danxiaibacter flavus]|uniref:Helix-turn-helix transcriptional regulator n=1 Tax=Danxiaibacter flavus TaxID=3049108 RepID=A0ABV3ZM52_9BACT|nr:helix-turn-helix transcriptional regulator [Chitinophagaceae bacterium DXS]
MAQHTTHLGEKIKGVREMLGIKQDALAIELGDDWNQKKVSMLEAKAEIDPALLEKVAAALKVPKEMIENYDRQNAINFFSSTYTFNDNSSPQVNEIGTQFNINPLEKMLEIYKEKEVLFERMLKDKDEMIAKLESLMKKS